MIRCIHFGEIQAAIVDKHVQDLVTVIILMKKLIQKGPQDFLNSLWHSIFRQLSDQHQLLVDIRHQTFCNYLVQSDLNKLFEGSGPDLVWVERYQVEKLSNLELILVNDVFYFS